MFAVSGVQVTDLYAVAAQAAAQVDRARQSAKASVQAALSQKPQLKLHVTLDAPKVAIPIPAVPDTADGTALACACDADEQHSHAGMCRLIWTKQKTSFLYRHSGPWLPH